MEGDRFNVFRENYSWGSDHVTNFYITDRLSQEGISSPKSMGHAVVKTKSGELANILCKFMNASCSDVEPLPSIFNDGVID
jgi:hypothetical protein